ncbi:hypothetical protein GCM10022198_04610 [Klugiella xanthotipulae]|uniref:Membrane protein DedA with SNARE-associated domain n=1 Tax=Klugiella xanthotipulae TaxID=244735 RepID=A0A543HSH2_9MICO|nr:VTT domain-containing protein [Klugiella xanthotipulae]TQM61282.1 membrane protein DedA with SNARE-associated domain [Klugiella xanthotipulae]
MEFVNDVVASFVASPWLPLVVLLLVAIDGFFPPVPSESVVVGLAALAAASGSPNIWLIMIAAAVGAVLGDHAAYTLGRLIGVDRIAWMRRPRIAAAVTWAQRGLERRAATLILTARFIPVGRVAVNMTAGATRFSRRRFLLLTLIAAACWSLYSTMIGLLAGAWLGSNPMLGAVLAIVGAIILGIFLDLTIAALTRGRDERQPIAAGTGRATDTSKHTMEPEVMPVTDTGPQTLRR